MTPSEYITAALRTKSTNFYSDKVPYWKAENVIYPVVNLSDLIDEIKKGLFYGRETPYLDQIEDTGYYSAKTDWKDPDIVHGILGIFTEAKELLDEMMYIDLDRKAVIDEMGDLMWYMALLVDAMGVSWEEVMERNIEKLRARYPEKFTEELAISRMDEVS